MDGGVIALLALLAATALLLGGVRLGLALGDDERTSLANELVRERKTNEALRQDRDAIRRNVGQVLQNVRARNQLPANRPGIQQLLRTKPDAPSAGVPPDGAPGPGGPPASA